jgi:Cu2+-exporting ATPase
MGALNIPLSPAGDNLSSFVRRDAGTQRFEVAVSGARCAGCIAKIEQGMKALPGVAEARLNLSTGKLSVSGPHLSGEIILKRIEALGYRARPYEAAASQDDDRAEGRTLLKCLAVSGFATVFVMGLTDAIWYGPDLPASLRQNFFWLAGAVAIPAALYAGQPFFRSALKGLAARRTNMDLPISLALLLALGLSLWQTAQNGVHTYFDAAVMLAFLLLVGRYLDFKLRDRARGAARHLLAMQSVLARRVADGGQVQTVAAAELKPGDKLLLATGDRIAANGVLGGDTELDVSLVTGEAAPKSFAAGAAVDAGAIVTGPAVAMIVSASVDNSLVADLARLLEAGQQNRNAYVRLADRAARAYVPLVLSLSLMVLAGWLVAGAAIGTAVTNAIAVLIITCPCALGLAVPAVQIVATGRLFGQGLFVKSGDALERLAEIDMAIFDKTGTLTWGTPRLVEMPPPELLARAALLARASRHPFAKALADAAGPGPAAGDVRETAGGGLERGSGAGRERLGSAAWCGVERTDHALWYRRGDEPAASFAVEDVIRPDAASLIAALGRRGIQVEMLTGDTQATAARIAGDAGIGRWRAAVTPTDKAAYLKKLAAGGHRALMVGDGINDAAAMALAHVSIAPGSATDISQRASDMVLRGDSLLPIVKAFDVARKARRLMIQNFAMAALYNLAAIPLAAMGLVTPLIAGATMAASSLLVTLNALRLAGRP